MRRIVSQRERNEYWQRTAALPQLLADAIDQGVLSDWVKENPNWLKSLGKDPGFADAVKKNVGPSWAQLQNILVNFAMNHDEFAPLAYGALDASKKQMADKYWGQETTPPDWWHPKKAIAKPKDQTLKQLLAKPGLTDTELYDWLDKHPKVDNALKNPDDPAHEGVLSELADKLAPFLSPTNYPAVHEYATPSDPDYKTLLQNNDEYTDVDPAKLKTPEFQKWWSQLSQGQKNYFADQPAEALDEQTNFFGEGGFLDTPESIANTSVDDVMDLLHTPNSPAPGAIDYSEDVDPHEPQVLSTGLGHSTSFNKWVKDHGLADSASQLYTEDLTAYQKACEQYKREYAAGYDKVPPWKPETVINFLKSQGWPENSSGFETLKAYPEMIEENLKTWKSNAAAQAALQKFFPQGGPETNADQPYTPTTFKTKGMPGHTPAWMGSGKQQGEADEQGNYFYEISPGMDAWLQAKGVTPEEVNSWPLNDSLKKEWQALSHSQKDAWAAYETGGASPGAYDALVQSPPFTGPPEDIDALKAQFMSDPALPSAQESPSPKPHLVPGFHTPQGVMTDAPYEKFKPEFEKWLWDNKDKNYTDEQFVDQVNSYDPQQWKAIQQAYDKSLLEKNPAPDTAGAGFGPNGPGTPGAHPSGWQYWAAKKPTTKAQWTSMLNWAAEQKLTSAQKNELYKSWYPDKGNANTGMTNQWFQQQATKKMGETWMEQTGWGVAPPSLAQQVADTGFGLDNLPPAFSQGTHPQQQAALEHLIDIHKGDTKAALQEIYNEHFGAPGTDQSGSSPTPGFATETKTLGQKLHELEPVMDAAKIDAMDPVKQMEVLNKIYSPQSSDPVSQAAQKVIEQHFGIGHLKEGPPLTKKPPSGSQQTFPGMSQTELHHDMPGSASWNVLHDRAKRDRSFGPQDMGLIEDPEFRKWFESAPADYRSVYQHHPAIALDDYGIAQKGGPAYGPVPQGDQGMEYQLDMTPTTTYKKDVEGYPYWPGWTKNPEASSGAGRPKNKWEDDAELLSGQGEIPLPPGSTWVPGQKQKLHRGLNLNLNYWNNRRQSHDGLTPAEEEQAAKLDAIAKIWRGSSEFDLLHPQPEGWAENVPFTSVPSGGKGALDFASWALKNRIPPEQMYDLAESWGLPGDDYGPRPSKTQIPANPMHPDLGNMVLDYIENNPKTWEYVPHGIQSGIGPHWSTKEDVSKHSFASNNATKDNIPVVVSGDWTGRGEDPDRPHGANGYPSEHEITLAPGGQVAINRVQFQAPHTGEWHEVPVTPHVRAASLSHSPLDKVLETR